MGVYLNSTPAELTLAKDLDKRPLEAIGELYKKKYAERAAEIAEIKKNEELLGKKLNNVYDIMNVGEKTVKKEHDETPVNAKIREIGSKINDVRIRIGEEFNKNPNPNIDHLVAELNGYAPEIRAVSKEIDNQNAYVKSLDKSLAEHKGEVAGNFMGINNNTRELLKNPNAFTSENIAPPSRDDIKVREILFNAAKNFNDIKGNSYDKSIDYNTLGALSKAIMTERNWEGLGPDKTKAYLKEFAKVDPQVKQYLDNQAQAQHEGNMWEMSKSPEGIMAMHAPLTHDDIKDLPVEDVYQRAPDGSFIDKDGGSYINKNDFYKTNSNGKRYFDEEAYRENIRKEGKIKPALSREEVMYKKTKKNVMGITNSVGSEFQQSQDAKRTLIDFPKPPATGKGSGSDDPNSALTSFIPGDMPYIPESQKTQGFAIAEGGNLRTIGGYYENGKSLSASDIATKVDTDPRITALKLSPENLSILKSKILERYNPIRQNGKGSFSNLIATGIGNPLGLINDSASMGNLADEFLEKHLSSGADMLPADAYEMLPIEQKAAVDDRMFELREIYKKQKVNKSNDQLIQEAVPYVTNKSNQVPASLYGKATSKLLPAIKKSLLNQMLYKTRGADGRELQLVSGESLSSEDGRITVIESSKPDYVTIITDVVGDDGNTIEGKEGVAVDLKIQTDPTDANGLGTQKALNAINRLSLFSNSANGQRVPYSVVIGGKLLMRNVSISGDNMYLLNDDGTRVMENGKPKLLLTKSEALEKYMYLQDAVK